MSSSRRAGGPVSIEIVVEIEGEVAGHASRSRSTLAFEGGQAALTGLSVALNLSRLLGLEGGPAALPGLYLPERLLDSEWYLGQVRNAGADVVIAGDDASPASLGSSSRK